MSDASPQRAASKLRAAADEIALFENLPALQEASSIQQLVTMMQNVQSTLSEVNQRLNRIENRIDAIESRMDRMETRMDRLETSIVAADLNSRARVYNSAIAFDHIAIEPLRTRMNSVPSNFPTTLRDLNAMTTAGVRTLLGQYELETTGTLDDRRRRLLTFLGIIRA
ncbi:hypothetical protein L228DRAFT_264059 [Xylona heveae TC161]|uniref:Uncharacterized protein n=1 Tax=Xylona heveae (strain CBS 132557 / TC161) TaxID=1328760 RepID=A0A164ZCC9_XYLHT|nr:hypothetical protein L228DRAFT_264059 [Xylona heveae TC161]KZF18929.1 hypothetical protein L228DRAFT_264059 [Xylona heveae TC161]